MAAVGQPYDYVASVWSFGDRSTISSGLTRYLAAPGGTGLASELAVVALHAGTMKNLRWSCAASTLTGSGNKITLVVNGVATPLTATWNGPATSGSGTPDLVPIAPGDTLSVRIQLAAGGTSITRPRVSLELALPSDVPWLTNGTDVYYDDGGSIGIGTDSPSEALSVNGTIEAMAGGFRFPDGTIQTTAFGVGNPPVPPGAVIAYAGAAPPAGWLLCDGRLVSRATYPALLAAIGIAHGMGDGVTTFALPDYRGQFLRGVSGASNVDPDAANRTPQAPGGNVGNAVGTAQKQQMTAHFHTVGVAGGDSTTMVPGGGGAPQRIATFKPPDDAWTGGAQKVTGTAGGSPPNSPTSTGVETRPTNAYVNFLIKT